MKSILVVCVGNICRSPVTEALLKQQFPERTIWSAGLGALVGNAADPLAIEVAAAHGLDLSAHRAQQLAAWMCQSAELILVMEQRHKTEIEQLYPLVRGKVFRLGELGKFEIADPYRQPKAAFDTAYAHIARGVAEWAPRIWQLG
jgi:protein-tyrosine phosphatase